MREPSATYKVGQLPDRSMVPRSLSSPWAACSWTAHGLVLRPA